MYENVGDSKLKQDRIYMDKFWRRFFNDQLDGEDYERLGNLVEKYIPLKSEDDIDEC